MSTTGSDEKTRFLNVDLDVESTRDLAPLVLAFGDQVFDLHTGPGGVGYECHLELGHEPASAEAAIHGFLRMIDELPTSAMDLWLGATRRDFNVGVQSGLAPAAFELALSPELLTAVGERGARLVVTIYAVDTKHLDRKRRRAGRA